MSMGALGLPGKVAGSFLSAALSTASVFQIPATNGTTAVIIVTSLPIKRRFSLKTEIAVTQIDSVFPVFVSKEHV